MSIKGLETKIKSHSREMFEGFCQLFSGVYKDLSGQQTLYVAITSSYCLKNEQLLNEFLKVSKINFEHINVDLVKHAIVLASRLSILGIITDELGKILENEVDKVVKPGNFDVVEFLMCLFAALNIFSSRDVASIVMKKLEDLGFSTSKAHSAIELISIVRAAHELIKVDSIRTYEFIAREENI